MGLAVIAGLAFNWLVPLPFLPADLPAGWLGAMVFVFALALFAWAIVTITRASSNVLQRQYQVFGPFALLQSCGCWMPFSHLYWPEWGMR